MNVIAKDKDDEDSDTADKSTFMNEEMIVTTQSTVDEITEKLKELRMFPKLEHRRRHLNQVRKIFIYFFSPCLYSSYSSVHTFGYGLFCSLLLAKFIQFISQQYEALILLWLCLSYVVLVSRHNLLIKKWEVRQERFILCLMEFILPNETQL